MMCFDVTHAASAGPTQRDGLWLSDPAGGRGRPAADGLAVPTGNASERSRERSEARRAERLGKNEVLPGRNGPAHSTAARAALHRPGHSRPLLGRLGKLPGGDHIQSDPDALANTSCVCVSVHRLMIVSAPRPQLSEK
jgi:hypothetical protein